MAFHVACPITCRRICNCSLGFGRALQSAESRARFLVEVSRIEQVLRDPCGISVSHAGIIQVGVPKVVPSGAHDGYEGDDAEEESVLARRLAFHRKAAADDVACRFQSGDVHAGSRHTTEEQGLFNANIICQMCFLGEIDGSEAARRMLPCRNCGKKFHRVCLKAWAHHRDLFHWSLWTCPSCRCCEVCQRTGDPNKLMFCKRCDAAYHCHCQHPPHKNVPSGPYLCPKHTKCHSCGSNVPGNGLSVRWFLGYTFCDACGRLFVKGNYCPVCLKVYRDSESTPMVCCDICQRWVHCLCDGISDEKYLQFQVDGNLQYKCATCRGECYQVQDLEDAIQEIWRRRDRDDRDLINSLRESAMLQAEEDAFSLSLYSEDEDKGPLMAKSNGPGHSSLKLSFKALADGKKPPARKKPPNQSNLDGIHHGDECGPRTTIIKNVQDDMDDGENPAGISKSFVAKKLVINLGARKVAMNSLPSDSSSCQMEQRRSISNGSEDARKLKPPCDGRRTNHVLTSMGGSTEPSKTISPDPAPASSSRRNTEAAAGGSSRPSADIIASESNSHCFAGRPPGARGDGENGSNASSLAQFPIKLKIKKPVFENENPRFLSGRTQAASIRGQRSKRKRSSVYFTDKALRDQAAPPIQDSEMVEASWVLKKLGKESMVRKTGDEHSDRSW